ncbi:acetyl/propionyl/methylcrotonyl-CoA carboxylase subunit alpha [Litorimonas sp. WD9-15]|uniref:acetyl/propionyl/methylcrotonyl-CoA carboxylase subunit alpha n=1 Tax=Litorimonas sp. WD9-15 TaxID=3418716 RepID=UPI003CFE5F5D
MSIHTILIANRGEIACRIMRTVRDMGLRSVAVYSNADRDAPHVKLADQAVPIGPAPVGESYLVIKKIIEAAKTSGADAIHPGYGFLSENAGFAKACADAGIIFIGPSPDAIALMGDKAVAKRRMITAGVPCVPGYQGEAQDDARLIEEAKTIGFPLMVKAAAGGGGRGMRLVDEARSLSVALTEARSEALNAFGSDILILERAIIKPRHVEIQIFGDSYGNIIHLGERDCSVQRRHQKVIEESPCPVMTEDLRNAMGDAAVKAAQSVDYVGAGTVEFMLDAEKNFYFLEMNTRLQVEHPVTELVTGLNLVALQLRVAQGEPLGLAQDDIWLCGHAIEARLYAEDPTHDFLPATGDIARLSFPEMEGLRVDSGVVSGGTVSPFYDPMLAKLIASGPDRETARRSLIRALEETVIFGVVTNRQFLIETLQRDDFASGQATTAFIAENFSEDDLAPIELTHREAALAALVQHIINRETHAANIPHQLLGWSSATSLATPYIYEDLCVDITSHSADEFTAQVGEQVFQLHLIESDNNRIIVNCDGKGETLRFASNSSAQIHISFGARQFHLTNKVALASKAADAIGEGDIRATMHGVLADIFVTTGDAVKTGDRLGVLEAMKMRHDILADRDGTVEEVFAKAGMQIAANSPILKIEN